MKRINKSQANNSFPTNVLVIDDDDSMVEMLNLILEPERFKVTYTQDSSKGIDHARQLTPDVILINLLMPDMSGWEICKSIREFSQVPILVLSAITKPGMVAKALDEGADDYLLKPMTSNVLAAHVKRLARRSRAEKDAENPNVDYIEI